MSDDLIDRQAAIDALGERPMVWVGSDYELGARNQYDADVLALETVPSAQPQSCKDAVSKADVLETYSELYDVFDDNKEIKNELHKIYDKINALKAVQPQSTMGQLTDAVQSTTDCISRQAAIDALTEYWKGISDRHPTLDGEMAVYADCKGIIKRLPSAQPQRIKGRWVGTDYDGFADGNPVYDEWKCSICGCVVEDEEPTWNFCPNCGADMRGEE